MSDLSALVNVAIDHDALVNVLFVLCYEKEKTVIHGFSVFIASSRHSASYMRSLITPILA